MNLPTKIMLTASVLGIAVLGLSCSGWPGMNKEKSELLSRQDKNSVDSIERQEATGRITQTQAAMEKDSIGHDSSLKF